MEVVNQCDQLHLTGSVTPTKNKTKNKKKDEHSQFKKSHYSSHVVPSTCLEVLGHQEYGAMVNFTILSELYLSNVFKVKMKDIVLPLYIQYICARKCLIL